MKRGDQKSRNEGRESKDESFERVWDSRHPIFANVLRGFLAKTWRQENASNNFFCRSTSRQCLATATARLLLLALFFCRLGFACASAAETSAGFDQANKLYEEGKFSSAAAAYEKLIAGGQNSSALYFNLGNAWFKAGQPGRAVIWYRRAEALTPRDPDIKANLQYIRKNVGGGTMSTNWRQWLHALNVNEWTTLTTIGVWVWLILLTLREWRPALRPALRSATLTAGIAAGVLAVVLIAVWRDEFQTRPAVVVVSEAVVRRGPLEESQGYFHLRDGAEVTVLDQKDNWLQISDGARVGWVRREQLELVHGMATKPVKNARANG